MKGVMIAVYVGCALMLAVLIWLWIVIQSI